MGPLQSITTASTGARSGCHSQARYYDPTTSQFLSRDALEAATARPYAYAGNSPLNRTDPTGAIDVGAALERALTTGWGKRVTEGIVGFGNGASFGLAGKIANSLSSGAMCTINTNSGWYIGGEITGTVATGVTTGGSSGAVRTAVAAPRLGASAGRLGGNASFGGIDDAVKAMTKYSQRNPVAGSYDVIGHGTPSSLGGQSASQIAEKIREASAGQDIRLLACKTGCPSGTFAQDLANKLGARVTAPTTDISASGSGKTFWIHDGGKWVTFLPGG